MSEHAGAHWQVQEAKQRFSEVLREVERNGPQTITRHGEEVAVVIDIAEYRRLMAPRRNFVEHLMAFPKLHAPQSEPDVFDEIESERRNDFAREVDLGSGA
jgi:prevent-host-death family protein